MQSTSAFYAILRALFQQLDVDGVLPNSCALYDGLPTDHRYANNYLLIGVEDPEVRGAASSANATQDWAHILGPERDEEGEITCAARSYNGTGDAQAARDEVEAITVAVEQYLRENRQLRPTPQQLADGFVDPSSVLLWTSYGVRSVLKQGQDEDGADAVVIFTIAYRARLF